MKVKTLVKILKWEKETDEQPIALNAHVGIVRYIIIGEFTREMELVGYVTVFGFGNSNDVIILDRFANLAIAKEACQQHFENLILSGLESEDV